jgi:SAM-dependent methyltransferase
MQILDVGCGAGRLVLDLRAAGFRATGIDRFAPEISDSMGLAVRQGELQDVSEQFDCVMFNHSLEHIADQVETLRMALSKVRANGSCIVRIPIAGWAWKEYGTDWVHLDAPRHLCVHTERSFRLAAGQAGFAVSETVYDSNDFLFWGSELYRRNVPLEDARYRLSDYFSKDCMKKFRRRALELNRQGQGDQAMFFLRRA